MVLGAELSGLPTFKGQVEKEISEPERQMEEE
jgi:hypothetical protein